MFIEYVLNMAKLKSPLFSLSASGKVSEALTFSERRGTHQVRYQRGQKDYVSVPRSTQRGYFQMAVSWWHQLTTDEQDEWDTIARYNC